MLLGGDIPDLIYFQGGDEQMAEQNLLEDLTPYIENSAYIKKRAYTLIMLKDLIITLTYYGLNL